MHIKSFCGVYPNLTLITSPELFFGTVKHQYPEYVESGFFHKTEQESIYVYQIKTELGTFTGLITCTDINDFTKHKVLKHENTLAAKEQHMMTIVLQNKAMVKPILLAYDRVSEIDTLMEEVKKNQKPFFNLTFDEWGEQHTIWAVTDAKKISSFERLFEKKVDVSYIADGHHRTSTSVSLYSTNHHSYNKESMAQVLSIYFSFDQLKIYDYNRVVEILNTIDPVEFMVKISKYCKLKKLSKPRKPSSKFEMTLFIAKKWYRLKWKKKVLRAYDDQKIVLDADLLNRIILNDICRIENIRKDKRIKYVDGVSGTLGIEKEVSKNEDRIGICLYPVTKEELKYVAEHEGTLPPKSTWFEPRIKNGMIVKEF